MCRLGPRRRGPARGRGDGLRRPRDDRLTNSAAPAGMNGYGEMEHAETKHLGARQRAALFDLPTDEAALLRHYTLSDEDIEHIRAWRGLQGVP